MQPKALLLDEPLGALDLKLREQMQVELKQIQRDLGITFIFVTHDQEEALTLSDRIAVFNDGRIEQLGTPRELYERPGIAASSPTSSARRTSSTTSVAADPRSRRRALVPAREAHPLRGRRRTGRAPVRRPARSSSRSTSAAASGSVVDLDAGLRVTVLEPNVRRRRAADQDRARQPRRAAAGTTPTSSRSPPARP